MSCKQCQCETIIVHVNMPVSSRHAVSSANQDGGQFRGNRRKCQRGPA